MKYVLFAIALVLALTGCTTVRTVDLEAPSVRYQVTLTDGRQFEAIGLQSTVTSLSWIDPDTKIGHAYPRSQVQALTYTKEDARYSVDPAQFEGRSPRMGYISEINTRAQRQKARVRLTDGSSFLAASLQVTPDSTSWKDPQTDHFETVATAEIREIRFVDHGTGVLKRAGIGLLTGTALGALIGSGARSKEGEWSPNSALLGAFFFGGLGGLLGVTVGAISSYKKSTYRFNIPAIEPQVTASEGQSIVLKNTPRRKP